MSLRRELAVSFAVQGAGAASVLLATVWLGAVAGPQVQGSFNRAKSELEFIGALATFGLPQALFFHVRSGRVAWLTALRWAGACTLLAVPIGACAMWLFDRSAGGFTLGLAAAAVAALVAQGQLRALLLVRERATRFNLATAAPQVLTLAGVGLAIAFAPVRGGSGSAVWFGVFLVAYATTALIAWRDLPVHRPPVTSARDARVVPANGARGVGVGVGVRVVPKPAPGARDAAAAAPTGTREQAGAAPGAVGGSLLRYGLAAWLTAGLATAAILAVQRWVEVAAGAAALGRFTMAMTLTQVPLTPIGYAAPLLLRRWIHTPGPRAARRWSAALFGVLLGVAALVALLARWRADLGLGAAYAGAADALALLLAGGAAEAASRVLAVQANATGLPWVVVRAEAARALVLGLAWVALPRSAPWLAICGAWSTAAFAAAAVLAWHGRGNGGSAAAAMPGGR